MSKRVLDLPANDNEPADTRRIVNELAPDLPIGAAELQLVETYLSAMIAALVGVPANDNEPNVKREGEP